MQDGEGYLLDVQNDLLDNLNTRVMVPLMRPEAAPTTARRLNPAFDIEGRVSELKHPAEPRSFPAPIENGFHAVSAKPF